ncbi:hypothetical protein E2C01_052214 [Portunus trituberculatus]|uniref:Uncharacterized protein n=1 Tax=Portunus trituberculatus TaxID=210409 RepID=A0A5B7GME9_PORTR|nr:hypothetical protein [Portunus trituberculatus]
MTRMTGKGLRRIERLWRTKEDYDRLEGLEDFGGFCMIGFSKFQCYRTHHHHHHYPHYHHDHHHHHHHHASISSQEHKEKSSTHNRPWDSEPSCLRENLYSYSFLYPSFLSREMLAPPLPSQPKRHTSGLQGDENPNSSVTASPLSTRQYSQLCPCSSTTTRDLLLLAIRAGYLQPGLAATREGPSHQCRVVKHV